MFYIGIDPGYSGGMALLSADGVLWAACKCDMTESDVADKLRRWTSGPHPCKAVIEKVHSMPKQGVSSSFKFGMSYGFLRGLLVGLKIPFEEVSPQRWQKYMQCLTHGDKNVSKAKAQQLFPSVKITHATADAILLAEYLRRTNLGSQTATAGKCGT
jgi:hypothetical protein